MIIIRNNILGHVKVKVNHFRSDVISLEVYFSSSERIAAERIFFFGLWKTAIDETGDWPVIIRAHNMRNRNRIEYDLITSTHTDAEMLNRRTFYGTRTYFSTIVLFAFATT